MITDRTDKPTNRSFTLRFSPSSCRSQRDAGLLSGDGKRFAGFLSGSFQRRLRLDVGVRLGDRLQRHVQVRLELFQLRDPQLPLQVLLTTHFGLKDLGCEDVTVLN